MVEISHILYFCVACSKVASGKFTSSPLRAYIDTRSGCRVLIQA